MRTIKFRGITVDTRERVTGDLITDGPKRYIYPDNSGFFEFTSKVVEVLPESVGQFTGLLDKDGREIWEGDTAIHLHSSYSCVVVFQESTAMFLAQEMDDDKMGFSVDDVSRITGTIHDYLLKPTK